MYILYIRIMIYIYIYIHMYYKCVITRHIHIMISHKKLDLQYTCITI